MNPPMTSFERLRYSFYLAVVSAVAIGLFIALASADVIGLLPATAFELIFSPFYFLAVFVVAFFAAPWVARWLPIERARS